MDRKFHSIPTYSQGIQATVRMFDMPTHSLRNVGMECETPKTRALMNLCMVPSYTMISDSSVASELHAWRER